ncbi:MAG: glycosyltransferase family 1 protein [Syntrophales bacterium]
MKPGRALHIGIYAGHIRLGDSGGTEVFKNELVTALARHAQIHHYTVILDRSEAVPLKKVPNRLQFGSIEISKYFQHFDHLAWLIWRRKRMLYPDLVDYLLMMKARRFCLKLGIDVLHFPATVIPPQFCSLGFPAVLTFFDMQHEFFPDNFSASDLTIRRLSYRKAVESVDRIIAPSGFTRQTLVERYGTPEEKISLLPVGVPGDYARVSKLKIIGVRRKHGLPENYIFYPANPWPHKNHEFLLRAFKRVISRWSNDLHLVFTGRINGNNTDIGPLITDLGISARVHELGFVQREDMPTLYSGARMMVFPSRFEGFGMPVLEAMACGCPVAAANSTSIPEVAGGAALLFDPMDEAGMADAILKLLEDPELSRSMVERGYRRASELSWENIVPRLERLYSDTFDRKWGTV